jgi:hypothetical protein
MRVTDYQMHHVLDCYSKKLSKARREGKPMPAAPEAAGDEVSLSTESLRQAALDKISRRISSKLDEVRALTYRRGPSAPAVREALPGPGEAAGLAPRGCALPDPQPERAPAPHGRPSPSAELTPLASGRASGKEEPWV